ncbi:hypothetical protein [Hyphococcus sp.]|uniref:hypothetical protein n=1 Tax=Hyphococcus sp. TaxID=2038636 RepID=UPI00208CBBA7|nr:MAG: hypothetical protein DHS20C04_29870 [Marinicaulis sp.]
MTKLDQISAIEIDKLGSLRIFPKKSSFAFIYRSGREVNWDEETRSLFSAPPREWTYAEWFGHIIDVCKGEYGIELKIDQSTVWRNISDELRASIMQGQK